MNAQINDNFMVQLIDKDAVVAEIQRLHGAHSGKYGCDEVGMNLEYLEDFLGTLEVKEVDLEKEIHDYHITKKPTVWFNTLESIAKHFFELGLKAKQS